ncbi:hypothetical protein ACLOJK_033484 [Asimina triloba]
MSFFLNQGHANIDFSRIKKLISRMHVISDFQRIVEETGVRDLSWYLQMKPVRLPFKYIDIKLYVERYLDSAFYEHTAMCPYNWKVYSEMRQLAEMKYGLLLDDIHLPTQSLDNGSDVIDIMQNLPKFAENYSYNINNQIFIEKLSTDQGRKSLRIIGVEHISSSLATHGGGIIPVALSSVFKFLKQELASLSELLQDNLVKSHLVKEFKFWKFFHFTSIGRPQICVGDAILQIDKGTINKPGLVEAEEHNIAIGRPPLPDHGLVFLEQLWHNIVELGNVLGLVRSLQAGDSRHVGRISQSFEEFSRSHSFIDEAVMAGRIMDIAIKNRHQSDELHNYFSFLISEFSKELQSGEYIHLRDFFQLVPALIISLVDSKVHSQDKKLRGPDARNPMDTDDGFMMGVAYILKVTSQETSFDGLHWFADARKQFKDALAYLAEARGTEQRKGIGLVGLRLWGEAAASSISPETQKGIDKLKKHMKEIEHIEYGLNASKMILS